MQLLSKFRLTLPSFASILGATVSPVELNQDISHAYEELFLATTFKKSSVAKQIKNFFSRKGKYQVPLLKFFLVSVSDSLIQLSCVQK